MSKIPSNQTNKYKNCNYIFPRVLREQFQNKLPNSFQTKEDITAIEPIPNRKSFH